MAEIVEKNPRNGDKPAGKAKRSRFDIKKHLWGTYRFAEYGVNRVINALTGGTYQVNSMHELRTYTLKAPLMAPVKIYKDYYQVPKMAVLPLNWEKLYTQPKIGEDVDFNTVGTYVQAEVWSRFINTMNATLVQIRQDIIDYVDTINDLKEKIKEVVRHLCLMESVYSNGALINALGYKASRLFRTKRAGKWISFDTMFDTIFNEIPIGFIECDEMESGFVRRYTYRINPEQNVNIGDTYRTKTKHEFIEKAREGEKMNIVILYNPQGQQITDNNIAPIKEFFADFGMANYDEALNIKEGIDLIRLWSYQLICAEYYTSDTVDYVYSAELFRQLIGSYIKSAVGGYDTFSLNGIEYEYDYLSSYYFGEFVDRFDIEETYYYLAKLFGYNRSLKYKDYFVGSRTKPLANGNFNITVNTNLNVVSVLDITKGIQGQRFANAVNKFSRNIKDYVKGLLGIDMKIDWHQPLWLASTQDYIGAQEIENTGEAQITQNNSITTILRNGSGRYQIYCDVDRDSILMGITHFDIERAYWKGANRTFFQKDRADWWNPYLQYTGDQPIYASEYDVATTRDTFGYQGAYEEYKQEVNEAFGGFIENLPGYIFLDDRDDDASNKYEYDRQISPDFIRAKNSEFDKFYINLTGNSLGSYFHFIIDNYSEESNVIPLASNPEIL